MRVLVIGSGGREHALCWKLATSPLLTKLFCAPGNPGIAEVAECLPIGALDIAALVAFAKAEKIDLVVPGPEAPLVAGITDAMDAAGIACFGPTQAAAQLEGSKSFTKEIADAAGVPTAKWERFDDAESARDFVTRRGAPIVIKADGLAAGKGVVVAQTEAEALAAIDDLLPLSGTIIIEECMTGPEVSLFALCDGTTALKLASAQDHKRVGDGDTGPNTGGMGAYSPAPIFTAALEEDAMDRIVRPTLAEMARRGTPFRGILYAGLMLTSDGPKLIEYNVRFGDPECQVLMLRLKSDLLAALLAATDGELAAFDVRWHDNSAIAVVMAARGYPANPEKHTPIGPLPSVPGVTIFHAGTDRRDGKLVSSGGRVFTICSMSATLSDARNLAYEAVDKMDWPAGFCRRDIGYQALK
jgi:phosphoribosylamine--glycine ligase